MQFQIQTEERSIFNFSLEEFCKLTNIKYIPSALYSITIGMDKQEKRVEIILVETNVTQ